MLRLATHTSGRVHVIIGSHLAFQIVLHTSINFLKISSLKFVILPFMVVVAVAAC
jgi:hypothetical protein